MIINDHAAVVMSILFYMTIRSYNQACNEVLAMYTVYLKLVFLHHALLPTLQGVTLEVDCHLDMMVLILQS